MPHLEIEKVKYQRLGLRRNPFPSIPMYSDGEDPFFSEVYVKKEFNLLRKLIVNNCQSKSSRMAIYVFGSCGCGKSTLFRNFVRVFDSNRHFLPIYCRFPFYGGLKSLYQEVIKRVDLRILRRLAVMVRNEYPLWPPSYFLRKIRNASWHNTDWEMINALRISAYYAKEAFKDLVTNLTRVSKREKVVLFLDDLEHAWLRFTGVQRYRWEETLVDIIPTLRQKLIVILPINPIVLASCSYRPRPYFGMYNWRGTNLEHYIRFEPHFTVMMQKRNREILALALNLANNSVDNKKGKMFCENLVKSLPSTPIGSASEVLQDLYFETRRAAQGPLSTM